MTGYSHAADEAEAAIVREMGTAVHAGAVLRRQGKLAVDAAAFDHQLQEGVVLKVAGLALLLVVGHQLLGFLPANAEIEEVFGPLFFVARVEPVGAVAVGIVGGSSNNLTIAQGTGISTGTGGFAIAATGATVEGEVQNAEISASGATLTVAGEAGIEPSQITEVA